MNSENNTNPQCEDNSNKDESQQAFNPEWTDDTAPPYSSEDPGEDPGEDALENDSAESAETIDSRECEAEEDEKQPTGKASSFLSSLPLISVVLSACAITLLVSLAAFFFIDMAVSRNKEVVYLQVNQNDEIPEESFGSSAMLENFTSSVVIVNAQTALGKSTGTGIILSADGYIVTNYHVIENFQNVYVWLYGKSEATDAEVIGFSKIDDIAVIKIDGKDLRPATFAKSASCRIGERVYAIGTPEGAEFGWSVSAGIISSPDREIKIYDNQGILKKKMNVIQTDASVNQGNSGGPLINSRGEVVGIITLKLSDSAGMGFAIPSDGALIDIAAIISTGNADNVNSGIAYGRPLIGITGVGVEAGAWYRAKPDGTVEKFENRDEASKYSDSFYAAITGVYVMQISKGLDAETKVEAGDIITEINGVPVNNIYHVMEIINEFNGGDEITIKLYRNNKYVNVSVILGIEKLSE